MKLHVAPATALNTVTGYGPGYVEINATRHTGSLLLAPRGAIEPWVVAFDALSDEHFAGLLPRRPELVVLGTGARQRFPHPRLTRPLLAAGVGVEAMDTPAACRTYNILMSEGRQVLAALFVDG